MEFIKAGAALYGNQTAPIFHFQSLTELKIKADWGHEDEAHF